MHATTTLLALSLPNMGAGVLSVLALVALVILIGATVASRMKVAGPNEAFLITGRKGKSTRGADGRVTHDFSGQKVVMGASVFVLPVVQKLHTMDLSSRRIPIKIEGAVSASGVKVSLDGVAIVKVGGSEDAIRSAAQRFLGQQQQIDEFTKEVLAGSLRANVGRMKVEDIVRDRAKLSQEVAAEAENSLTNQGLALDTLQIQDIRSEGTFLEDLGRPEQARVAQEAAIAEAEAHRESERRRLAAEEQIALAERDLELKRAEIRAETERAAAVAAAAGPLEEAARKQEVLAQQELVAEREAALREKVLDTEVRKPADAARYQKEVEAEAAAEQARLSGDGELQRRAALAEAVEREGRAEAAAIEAKGTAEAAAIEAKAEAFQQYNEAAMVEMLVGVLPEVVGKASEPMAAIDNFTVISTDGASAATKSMASNITQGLQMMSDIAGVDLKGLLATFLASKAGAAAPAAVEASAQVAETHSSDAASSNPSGEVPGSGSHSSLSDGSDEG